MMKVYLDNAASTMPFDEVIEEVSNRMREDYANPSSLHTKAQLALGYIEESRDILANALNVHPNEIYFTSGATESNNLALLGYAHANASKGKHIITTPIEHHSVLSPMEALEKEGFTISYLSVDSKGFVNPAELENLIHEDTVLISIMWVNNEIGTVQDITSLSKVAQSHNIAFHVDGSSGFGKLPSPTGFDLFSATAHKCYGPKGVGLLYIKNGTSVQKQLYGGDQERGLRSGTLNPPLISGFGKAVSLTLSFDKQPIKKIQEHLLTRISNEIPDSLLNGPDLHERMFDNVNFSFKGVRSDVLLYTLDQRGIAAASGSACSAGSIETSHVIKAIGASENGASLRLSLGRQNTLEEIDYTVDTLKQVIFDIRNQSKFD
jgi:cysteine desulfurase